MDAALPRVIKLNQTEWANARKRAIKSLDPTCAICHHYIDVQLPMNDPDTGERNAMAVEVDHIVPRSRGGSYYELDNLQLTHMKCNRQKGAKMESDYSANKVENAVPWSNNW